MAVTNNTTTIPSSRVPLTDDRTGLIAREWYRYLNNQYTKTNQSANAVTPGDYGAIGDGAVDDSASIQAALDSGYDVYLPPGRIYAIGTTLTMSTPNQSFGGPGVLRIVGAINGVELISPTSLIVTGIQLDLTFDSPAQTAGWAVYVNNSSRIKISKLNIIDGYGGLYVQVANWVVVDWMWASLRGPGIKWYGDSTHRSDVLNLGFVVVDPGEGQYGMDWDGNCHSLNVLELGIVCGGGGGKGMIIRNTSGSPFPYIPAIGRIAHIEIDYAASHGVEIQAGLDYDFCIPYVLGCGTWPGYSGVYDGFRIAAGINAYEVRITGGKSVGNTGYGINNLGGVILYSGNTALYSNVLGEINGDVWTKSPRYVVDDYFYSTVISDTPYITFAENDYLSYNRAANQLNLQIGGSGTVTFSSAATQSYVPVYATGLRLLGSTAGYTGFSPSATGPSVTYTLPTAIGTSNQVLSTDGSNNLFWASVSGGGGVTSVGVTSPVVNTGTSTAPVIGVNATSANTPLYLVQRNGAGDFAGNYITGVGFYADATYYMQMAGANPTLVFDTNDYLSYDRTNNAYNFQIAGSGIFSLSVTATQTYKPLRLMGSTSGYVGFTVPATAGSTTYTLPNADGTVNQVLSTNGAGTLSWATVSGGGGVSSVGVTAPVINTGSSSAPVIAVNASSANTASYLVQRDGSGDFSSRYITATGFYADATYYMQIVSANPALVFDTNDFLSYDRANNAYNFQIAGNGIFSMSATAIQAYKPVRILGSSSGYVGLTVPAAAGSTTYTLPSSDGSNGQFLKTDGSGGLTWASGNAGTVTSVGAVAPLNASGTSVVTISLPQASSVASGYLTATDWNTFNNKQAAGTYVTSVGATGPVVSSGGTTPTISVNAATANTANYLVQRDGSGNFTAGTITATQYTVGSNYYLTFSGANPIQAWDASSYFSYDRTNNQLNAVISGNGVLGLTATSVQSYKPLQLWGSTSGYVGFAAQATAGSTTYTWPSAPTNGYYLQTDGSGNLSWAAGGSGAAAATPTTLGTVYGRTPSIVDRNSTALGYQAGAVNAPTGGLYVTAIGYQAIQVGTGSYNTAVGFRALGSVTAGDQNTAVGYYAGEQFTDAGSGLVGGNTFVGYLCGGAVTTAQTNTFVGRGAGYAITTGNGNTAIGSLALVTAASTTTNSTAVGVNADVTGSNQIQLGNGSTTCYTNGAVQNRSDIRDKAEVRDTQLGLGFINALRPVDYKWDMREDYRPPVPEDISDQEAMAAWREASKISALTHDGSKKRTRFHHGLIAQEVKAVLDAQGIDFGGYQDHSVKGGEDVLSIGYDELIAPLIKAVQELTARVKELEAKNG